MAHNLPQTCCAFWGNLGNNWSAFLAAHAGHSLARWLPSAPAAAAPRLTSAIHASATGRTPSLTSLKAWRTGLCTREPTGAAERCVPRQGMQWKQPANNSPSGGTHMAAGVWTQTGVLAMPMAHMHTHGKCSCCPRPVAVCQQSAVQWVLRLRSLRPLHLLCEINLGWRRVQKGKCCQGLGCRADFQAECMPMMPGFVLHERRRSPTDLPTGAWPVCSARATATVRTATPLLWNAQSAHTAVVWMLRRTVSPIWPRQ